VGILFGLLSIWAVESAFYLIGLGVLIAGFGGFLLWNVKKSSGKTI
jgi:hypothetical protein